MTNADCIRNMIVGFDLTPYCPNCGAKMDGGDNDAID